MIPVQMWIEIRGKSYTVTLSTIANGKEHQRSYAGEAEKDTTRQRIALLALLLGLEHMTKPAYITVKTQEGYLKSNMERLDRWENEGWKKTNGEEVKNRDLWKKVQRERRKHRITVILI